MRESVCERERERLKERKKEKERDSLDDGSNPEVSHLSENFL